MIAADIVRLSTHKTAAPVGGRCVIIHATRSGKSMNPTEFIGTINWMLNDTIPDREKVSSHWVISREGIKARIVNDNEQAWHAQEDNDNAWGIELEQGSEEDGFTPEQIQACIEVCRGYVDDFGVPPVHDAPGFEMKGFIGHQETLQGRRNGKSDPGHLFPWDQFIAALTFKPVPIASELEIDGPFAYLTFKNSGTVEIKDGDVWTLEATTPIREWGKFEIKPPL